MSALMIARIIVKDPEKLQEYLAKTQAVAATFGAELVHRGKVDKVLTGESADHEIAIIVKFPTVAKLDEWYGSDAYQPLIALRDTGADMRITSYEV
jgi:uncharacterized protein (DUF1330 family)